VYSIKGTLQTGRRHYYEEGSVNTVTTALSGHVDICTLGFSYVKGIKRELKLSDRITAWRI
jgi:hypothetical protein